MSPPRKVFVSGCFDLLHSGHVKFLSDASNYGEVYVGLGSDETVYYLKGRYPVNNQEERKYMLESLKFVHRVMINSGSGLMDFEPEIKKLRPDVLIVNEDGNSPDKEKLCRELNIEYKVLKRQPGDGLPVRSTTLLREKSNIPYRIDLAGGWLDQPYVSKHHPGAVITISIEPTLEFNERSGMASSTRRMAQELWHASLPSGNKEKLARILFSYENPPGKKEISGSQDALGIILPGLNKLNYAGNYWPDSIESVRDENILSFIESHLHLVNLGPRSTDLEVTEKIAANADNSRRLAVATENCWNALMKMDSTEFGNYFRQSFEAQVAIFPAMMNNDIQSMIDRYKESSLGWKLSGAGGGGYLVLVSENEIEGTIPIKIRRDNSY